MKKFLTVLLVIAVMFTFSFGSAFALPNDADGTEYAAVAEAQKDAYKAIDDYAKLSDYTAAGQSVLLVAKEAAKQAIKDAKTLQAVKDAVEAYEDLVDDLANELRANVTLKEAADKAVDMAEDYRLGAGSLYDLLVGEGAVKLNEDAAGFKAAGKKLEAAKAEFDVVIAAAYENVGTVEGIEAAFDKLVAAANEYGRAYFEEAEDEALADAIKALVEMIEDEHDAHIVNTTTHSAKVYGQYEDALKAGVKAAKAAKTWDELVDVYEEYVASNLTSHAYEVAQASGYEVAIVRCEDRTIFEQLEAMDKEMEADMAAAEKVLKELGAYDYHVVLLGGWELYEEQLDEMEDLADGYTPAETITIGSDEYDVIADVLADTVYAGMKAKLVNEAVDAAVEAFEAMQTVEAAKVAAAGLVDQMAASFLENNYPQTYGVKEIENLAKLAKTELKAAASLEEMVEIGIEYFALMSAIPTVEEIAAAEAKEANEKAIDKALEDAIAAAEEAAKEAEEVFALTADEQLFVDRFVAYAKAEEMAAADFAVEIANILAAPEYKVNALKAALFAPEFEDVYTDRDSYYVGLIAYDYTEAVKEAKSWTSFFKAVDAAKKALEAYTPAVEVEFEKAVAEAKKAVDELPVVKAWDELKAYDKAMVEVQEAIAELEVAARAAYGWADLEDLIEEYSNEAVAYALKLYDKAFEAEYVRYLGEPGVATSHSHSAEDFYQIAADMTDLMDNYAAAEQKEISTIITDAYKALRATKVKAEMDKIAEKAIADLDAVKEKAVDNEEYVEALNFAKEEAAKYFEKYYGVKFTSDAETQLQLAYDIMDKQDDLATIEAQIEAVEGLKITAGSSAKKGSITVKWTVKGDASKIDGYQVWKSTKKNSGFKKITAKTTKTQIVNKKGLKAGTRYYYKVRAFQVIEGKYYYSDWSNKAYRKAK